MCQKCHTKRGNDRSPYDQESEYASLFDAVSKNFCQSFRFRLKKWYRDYKHRQALKHKEREDARKYYRVKYAIHGSPFHAGWRSSHTPSTGMSQSTSAAVNESQLSSY